VPTMVTRQQRTVAGGVQQQLLTALCGAGVRHPEAAEMGIKQNGNNVGMIDGKFYIVKLLRGFIFICTLQCSPVASVFLVLSWPIVIIPSGLCLYQLKI
jgi:hypothetical protein